MLYKFILIYLLCANLAAFAMYGIDKLKAKKGKWRISEKKLILSAVAGGSVGAIFGMKVFHHKTLHNKFRIGLPLILVLQVALAVFIRVKFGT